MISNYRKKLFLFNGMNNMTIYARDSYGLLSNMIDLEIDVILDPIQFNISILTENELYECPNNDIINISGIVNDSSGYGDVEIVAIYDGSIEQILMTNSHRSFVINSSIQIAAKGLYNSSYISLFARNQCSGLSEMNNFTLNYICSRPILHLMPIDGFVNKIVISGSISHHNISKLTHSALILYKLDGSATENDIGSYFYNNNFTQIIEQNLYTGYHNISIYAIDDINRKSDTEIYEFFYANRIPVLKITNHLPANITRGQNDQVYIEGVVENSSTCDIYYYLDEYGPIYLGKTNYRQYDSQDFKFNISIDRKTSPGFHNITLYANSNYYFNFDFRDIKSKSVIHGFIYSVNKPSIEVFNFSNQYILSSDSMNTEIQLKITAPDLTNSLSIIYYFDERIHQFSQFFRFLYTGDINLSLRIDLPNNLNEGQHEIHIYAIDCDDVMSNEYIANFSLFIPKIDLQINNIAQKEYVLNQKINISGAVTYFKIYNNIKIFYLIDNYQDVELTNFSSDSDTYYFTYILKIPAEINERCHNISFKACDNYRHCSNYTSKQVFCYRKYPQTLGRDILHFRHRFITKSNLRNNDK